VAVHRLRRPGAGPGAIAADRVQQQRFDDEENNHRPPEDVGEQMIERETEIGVRSERRLWKRSAAGGKNDQDGSEEQRHGLKN